jgi:hypothetical protein
MLLARFQVLFVLQAMYIIELKYTGPMDNQIQETSPVIESYHRASTPLVFVQVASCASLERY